MKRFLAPAAILTVMASPAAAHESIHGETATTKQTTTTTVRGRRNLRGTARATPGTSNTTWLSQRSGTGYCHDEWRG